jgi:hypothetical protein
MTDTVRVPREPTPEMLKAGSSTLDDFWKAQERGPTHVQEAWPGIVQIYAAMLAASPQGEESPPAMSADHIPDAGNMIAPVEAVAWRLRRVGVARWNLWDLNPCVDTPAYANAAEWEVQSLYTHPAPIKPSADTEELQERVARIVDPAGFDDRWDVPGLRHEASLDERVDEALAKADAILDLIQSERAG